MFDGEYTITVVNANSFTVNRTENTSNGIASGYSDTGTYSYGLPANQYTLPQWGERTAGDIESAPDPSFIGRKINNVFFFRNRLGFLADDNVILSNVSEFFNFFPDTVLTVVDSHPIDVAASHTKVAILKHAVTMGEQSVSYTHLTLPTNLCV